MKLMYLGPEGTFSHGAAKEFAKRMGMGGATLIPTQTVAEMVIEVDAHVRQGELPRDPLFACVPLENSIEGSVSATWDAFALAARKPPQSGLRIVAGITLPITHHLLSLPGSVLTNITDVYSHPQALGQCRRWLHDHLPQVHLIPVASTAYAAQMISQSGNLHAAAIGPQLAADVYGLKSSSTAVQDFSVNYTRFGLVGNANVLFQFDVSATAQQTPSVMTKLSVLLVGVGNVPGGLLTALQPFADRGLNLSRIESRPVSDALGEYVFFLDVAWPEAIEIQGLSDSWVTLVNEFAVKGIEAIHLGTFHEVRLPS